MKSVLSRRVIATSKAHVLNAPSFLYFMEWIIRLFKSKSEESHVHTWGPVYLYKGYRFRNCTHPNCNTATSKDDNGNWLDSW